MEYVTSENTLEFNFLQLFFYVSHSFLKISCVVAAIAVQWRPENDKHHINPSDFKRMGCKSFHITLYPQDLDVDI